MSTMKLSVQDRKELEKFTKFLAYKSVQVIVQSRLGEKQKTRSKPYSTGSDWFNLDIPDLPEVQAEVKRAMGGQIPAAGGPSLCTEISLQTAEGDSLALETWQLAVAEACDPTVRAIYTVYNRMSILLKSLIAFTRVTPAYRLSARQGPDSYVICYRVYLGDPQVHLLGEGCKSETVGRVGTPIGTVIFGVLYRTKLTISPQRAAPHNPIMVKSDYFKPDLSPKWVHRNSCPHVKPYSGDTEVDGTKVADGALDAHKNRDYGAAPTNGHTNGDGGFVDIRNGAFAPVPPPLDGEFEIPEVPFQHLLPVENGLSSTDTVDSARANDDSKGDADAAVEKNGKESPPAEDFVLIELKPPFADSDGSADLGAFFHECQTAPMLSSFASQPTLEEQVSEISAHLAALESSLPDLDQFVESVCQCEALK
uniref:Autophagy-related protein 13 n=2 Tax=Ornithodoros turicata TaxID=34597 RepID=A0A2R5LA97_9ACAR